MDTCESRDTTVSSRRLGLDLLLCILLELAGRLEVLSTFITLPELSLGVRLGEHPREALLYDVSSDDLLFPLCVESAVLVDGI